MRLMINQESFASMRTLFVAISRDPSRFPSCTYKAENDSVYMKNYHQKRSPMVLLGQPVSYYDVDVLAFIYFIYFSLVFFPFSVRLRDRSEGTKESHSRWSFKSASSLLCWLVVLCFFVAHSEGTKERRSSVMILIFLYFYFAIYSTVHLLYNFYCSDRCCSQPQPRVYKTLFSAVSHFYRLREILSFASFFFSTKILPTFIAVNLNKIREMAKEAVNRREMEVILAKCFMNFSWPIRRRAFKWRLHDLHDKKRTGRDD